ncbi:FdhF/YdeP family oxidoreductase [Conexibacter woesei]|uniref:Oxidoreductase alpha (Molybdopterin) subunit n=1 Tax=Conexibacter woesei (strain DSM 14684 / CCUG 47730 / CIP 108061 / JCM 11494 / NBRC 100937 / ID131577) TaxID=469383 RepID=D3FDE9_CONWI|nr:FdhF/YdeP family oxidoreductase [Conexibacter woesei]ADB53541.1 oxidoreductase alpha (molybdopterin) subunit [Conexibacter woesei DSM 14684]
MARDLLPLGLDDEARLRVSHGPEHAAAGVPAVVWSMRHSLSRMGPVRTARLLARVNQKSGFDCPGCAWPDPEHRHAAEFCENGAKAVAEEGTTRRADAAFFARHSVADLSAQTDHWLGRQGRLTEPMLLADGATHYEPIGWDDAFGIIVEELNALGSPDEANFYTSGRTSNEAAFAYQLLVRAFGTNNLPDCSNMCHESSGSALTETIGIGKGSVSLEDLHAAELILVVGQNPGTNHPRMLSALEEAKRRGAVIVSVNPLPEAGLMRFKNPQRPRGVLGHGTALTDRFLQIRVNGDLALFKAVNRRLIELDRAHPGSVVDHAFVERHCTGFDALAADLAQLDPADVDAATGLPREQIDALADLIASKRRIVACWAMGLTQHRNSVATIREIVNTLLLRGSIGKPGAGVCPVRGHSNVQGDRTMGIYEKPQPAFLDALRDTFGFEPPREHGHDVVDAIRAMRDGRAHVFVAMGGNFLAAAPDTAATAAALQRQRLTVQVSTKLNRSHLVTGRRALILPALGRTERDVQASGEQVVSVEDSMSVVHASRGRLAPASPQLRSETAIVCGLARRLLGDRHAIPWQAFEDDYALLRDQIAATIPGFEQFNARLAQPDGFVLPHPPRDELRFETPSGRAHLTANSLAVLRVPEGRLLLQTLRSHDQYNTTVYGLNDRYRGIRSGRRVVLVHAEDLAALGVADGAIVDVVSEWEDGVERRVERFRAVAYPTARGCAAAYYPETNPLVPLDSQAERSGTPTSKSVVVRLEEPHA